MTKRCFKLLSAVTLLLGFVTTTWAQPFNPVDDAYNTLTDEPLSVPLEFGLSANDTTSLGTVPAITGVDDTGIAGALVVDQSNGSFTFTPSLGFTGTTSFTYTVDDGAGGNTMATVSLVVNDLENFCYVVAQNQLLRNGDPGLLARVDKATGSSTIIGALGAGVFLVETIAFGPGADTLFAVNANQLGYINLTTGMFAPAANTIGSGDGSLGTISFDDVDGLTFDPLSRHLLGTVRESGSNLDLLVMIDRQTGQHVPDAFGAGVDYVVVSGVLGDIDDIAYNPINRSIFAISNINGNNDELVEIDRTTGVATAIGAVSTVNDMEGFGFDNSGLLYGTTGKDVQVISNRNSFWSLNINNGLGTKINNFTYGRDYESCDCVVLPLIAAVDDRDTTMVDVPINILVLDNDYLGEPITNITFPNPNSTEGGTMVVDDNGTPDTSDDFVVYTPPAGFSGIDTFEYTITDADGRISTATVTIVILGDTDNDGIPDLVDLDSDNDGIPDVVEVCGVGATDFSCLPGGSSPFSDDDEDGILNFQDPDFCTLNAAGVCTDLDSDGDGIIDALDLDSDNDGLADVIEAGGADADGDGIIDGFSDTNNNNGYDDATEASPLPVTNSDTDAFPDYLDIDSENDGIIDNIESQTTAGYRPPSGNDTDTDGWDDEYDANNGGVTIVITNTDLADAPDYLDTDSDNDTILDNVEGHDGNSNGVPDILDPGTLDTGDDDSDGLYNSYDPDFLGACTNTDLGQPGNGGCAPLQDTDGTEDRDWRDSDDDGDGILTADEPTDGDGSGIPDYLENNANDNDGDGVPDNIDLDDDNDGIPDTEESGGVDATGDVDGDGTPNYQDPDFCTLNSAGVCTDLDTDGDGVIDQFDLDSDNDGLADVIEAGGADVDGDGIIDGFSDTINNNGYDDATEASPLPVTNSDTDAFPDYLDIDSENDGIIDNIESQTTAGYRPPSGNDTDTDGWDDEYDANNGGTTIVIINTDMAADAPDYLDQDSDDDTIPDNIEGHDGNSNGVPQPLESGGSLDSGDVDNDGLYNSYDPDFLGVACTSSTLGQPGNGGCAALQDTDGTEDRDWRDTDDDGDGILTANEPTDLDGSGIPDYLEVFVDNDGDGIPDILDPDDDNDGIPDVEEACGPGATDFSCLPGGENPSGDTDGDGTPNYQDPDFCTLNTNGVCDILDSDGDGIIDQFDLDSDNDGIPDITEAGGGDLDSDGDGVIDDLTDDDGDGLADVVDPDQGGNPLPNPDSDGDGNSDATDLDSDNDGIPDIVEAGGGALDSDGDGRIDDLTDDDGDGLADVVDPDQGGTPLPNPGGPDVDSDDDGITDVTEAGGTDADGDGIIDGFMDMDNDGLADSVDPDQGGTPLPIPDSDLDGFSDYRDIDADNDGIIDNIEGQTTADYVAPTGMDSDGDGLDNAYDPDQSGILVPRTNTDGDLVPDYLDDDSDDDTILDTTEGHDGNSDGTPDILEGGGSLDSGDDDNDGLYNSYDPDFLATCDNTDLGQPANGGCAPLQDTDGIDDRDWRDDDDDGDGILTADEPTDADGTGIPDYLEGFGDNDGDGINDLKDQDDDNDGIPDVEEACGPGAVDFNCLPGGENPVSDSDGDGTPNYQDPDFCTLNANGVCDILDEDGDGVIDQFDLDSDNDGIPDVTEAGGGDLDSDGDGVIDNLTDDDKDGLADIVDPDQGGTPLPVTDSDDDGVPNYLDLDSDNDGITDVIEAGGPDADGDGRIDGFIDADDDGLADSVDPTETGIPLPLPNSDGDPYPNYLDIDAEDDGIIDNIESQSTEGYRPPTGSDADGDGYDDAYDPTEGGTPISLEDTDGDTTPDYLDDDTDGDGVLDNIEGHDADSDGVPVPTASGSDNDEDGLDDAYDPDFISCSTSDLGQPGNGGCAALQNTDGTDDRDWRDTDDDNDGDPTLDEGSEDCDSDGIPNYLDDRDICDTDLVIYNGFSPNGDNKNDVWILDGIEKFPGNTVKVYNRWGNLVWQTEGYDNQSRVWMGESTEGIIIGDKMVPDGSYYYVIDLGNGSDPLSGYVVIHR